MAFEPMLEERCSAETVEVRLMTSDADLRETEQNERIRNLENRVNMVENDLASIMAKLITIEKLAKGLAILAGTAIGIDVVPMMGQ